MKSVICYHCKNWGYNRGKAMDQYLKSRCLVLKKKTDAVSWCKKFEFEKS